MPLIRLLEPHGGVLVPIRFQFGLKWFILAVALIPVLIGTVGKRLYDQWQNNVVLERRAQAIRELEEFGVRTYERDGVIVMLQFPRQVCKPKHFQMVADIGGLERLELGHANFRDADAATLLANPKLKSLNLAGNPLVLRTML